MREIVSRDIIARAIPFPTSSWTLNAGRKACVPIRDGCIACLRKRAFSISTERVVALEYADTHGCRPRFFSALPWVIPAEYRQPVVLIAVVSVFMLKFVGGSRDDASLGFLSHVFHRRRHNNTVAFVGNRDPCLRPTTFVRAPQAITSFHSPFPR